MDKDAVIKYALERYGAEPDFPWKKSPDYVVLRVKPGGKWFGLLMNIPRGKLGLEPEDAVCWVINLKCDPVFSSSLGPGDGVFPAYHMNKEKWISVVIDEADGELLKMLIDISYKLVKA